MKSWTLQKKWTYSSSISIFLSFFTMCIVLYFSLYNWMLLSEKKTAQNTLSEVELFLESKGSFLTIQDISRNRSLLTQIVNQKQSIRLLNNDGIELLRINNVGEFPSFSPNITNIFARDTIRGKKYLHKIEPLQFGGFSGYVEISHSLEDFSQLMNYILIAMFMFAVISLLLSAFIGYAISSSLLKPIRELREEMQRASKHKFLKEVAFTYTAKDELGELLGIYKQLMNDVSETISRQDDFIYHVSHELRTPIQVVEGNLSLLNRWGKDNRDVLDESLHISLMEIQKMKKLMEEMLKLARRQHTTESSQTNVLEIMRVLEAEYKLTAPKAIITMEVEPTFFVPVPQTAFLQIIRNLLDNAIRYNDRDPHIFLQVKHVETTIVISIRDNGIGIPSTQVGKIFDRFFTVDEARTKSKGGAGLGLSIVNIIVQEYGGRIDVESTIGLGTTFHIYFPFNTTK